MPGSGKTVVGRRLAGALSFKFVDLDEEAARQAATTLADLFRRGESLFRAAERQALERVCALERVVVAAGGGALVDSESLELARAAGTVVYLRATVDQLADRLAGTADRPLLVNAAGRPLGSTALRQRLSTLLASRAASYERADVVVDGGQSPGDVARAIADALRADV